MNREWCRSCGHILTPGAACECDPLTWDVEALDRSARVFWRGACETRALQCEKNAREYRSWSWSETDHDTAVDYLRQAEKHDQRAAWLRACAEAP